MCITPEKSVDGRTTRLLTGTELNAGLYSAVYVFDIDALAEIDPEIERI